MNRKCRQCNKEFKLIKQELDFYEKMGLPHPSNCPECRYELRLQTRNERQFHKYPCTKCGKEMVTTVNKNKGFIVYCNDCYADFRANVDLTKI